MSELGTYLKTLSGAQGRSNMATATHETDEPILRGLDTVRVKKEEVEKKVKENRDEHRKIFEEAFDGWKAKYVEWLEVTLAQAREGKELGSRFALTRPEDHTRDYDQVLTMLAMSQDAELELSAHEFANYIMDEWGWQHSFLMASMSSGSHIAEGKFSDTYGNQ